MSRSAILRSLTLRWVMFAFLAGSLAPWISSMLAAAEGSALTQVCSAQDARRLAGPGAADDPGQPAQDPLHAASHCPFCLHHVDTATPPAKVDVWLPAPGRHEELPRLFLAVARTPFAWACAQPRAPPPLA